MSIPFTSDLEGACQELSSEEIGFFGQSYPESAIQIYERAIEEKRIDHLLCVCGGVMGTLYHRCQFCRALYKVRPDLVKKAREIVLEEIPVLNFE